MADGFLGRWSQRKLAARRANETEKVPEALVHPEQAAIQSESSGVSAPSPSGSAKPGQPPVETASPPKPAPTLEDVQNLGSDGDYAPFAARDVAPEVRNAAMKKLFTDPHFQLMDRLDIYIDDYSLPSPLSPELLQKMVSAQFLKLVQTPDEADDVAQTSGQLMTPEVAAAVPKSAQAVRIGDEPGAAGHGDDPTINSGCP